MTTPARAGLRPRGSLCVRRPSPRRRCCWSWPPPRSADSASISVMPPPAGSSDAVAVHVPRVFTVAGTATAAKYLYVKHRAARRRRAARRAAYTDRGNVPDAASTARQVNGPFSFQSGPSTWDTARHLDVLLLARLRRAHRSRPRSSRQSPSVEPAGHDRGRRLPRVPAARASEPRLTVPGISRVRRGRLYAKIRCGRDGPPCAEQLRRGPRRQRFVRGARTSTARSPHQANTDRGRTWSATSICLWAGGRPPSTAHAGRRRAVRQTYAVVQPADATRFLDRDHQLPRPGPVTCKAASTRARSTPRCACATASRRRPRRGLACCGGSYVTPRRTSRTRR